MAWNWQGERGATREWELGKQGGRGNGGASSARRWSLFEEDTGAAQSRQITSKARSLEPRLESGGLYLIPPSPSSLFSPLPASFFAASSTQPFKTAGRGAQPERRGAGRR